MEAKDNKQEVSSRFPWGFLSVWHGIRARFWCLLSGVCASWRFQHFLLVICGFLVIAVGVFLGFDPFSSCVWGMYLSSLWITDDMHHIEAGNNSRILGDLTLRVIEVGRHCNNSILQVEPRWLRSWACHQNQDQERPWMTSAWDHSEPRHQRIFYQSTFGIENSVDRVHRDLVLGRFYSTFLVGYFLVSWLHHVIR